MYHQLVCDKVVYAGRKVLYLKLLLAFGRLHWKVYVGELLVEQSDTAFKYLNVAAGAVTCVTSLFSTQEIVFSSRRSVKYHNTGDEGLAGGLTWVACQ